MVEDGINDAMSEYKKVRFMVERIAAELSEKHKRVAEEWQHGEYEKIWFDLDGNLVIEYQDGEYWHYNEKGEWW